MRVVVVRAVGKILNLAVNSHVKRISDPITVTTIIPVTTITLSMTTTRKAITTNIRRIIRIQNIKKHHDDD